MKRILSATLCLLMIMLALPGLAQQTPESQHGFTWVRSQPIASEGAVGVLYRHDPSGLHLFYLDDGAPDLAFSIGFITPPANDRGANHVLEHAVLCGSEKYPVKTLMHHIRGTSVASQINATTNDQTTAYYARTTNEADFYNLLDVYINAVLHPLVLREENIFLQQGIRFVPEGRSAVPVGIVYNELRQRSLESGGSMLDATWKSLRRALMDPRTPAYSSGGEIGDLPLLTHEELIQTHSAYYRPDNALVFVSGAQDIMRTLALLDGYLAGYTAGEGPAAPSYTLSEQPGALFEGIAAPTAVSDIGFAFSGIPIQDARQVYARNAMLLACVNHLRETWPTVVMIGDDTTGYATFGIIVSGVSADQYDEVTAQIQQYLLESLPAQIEAGALEDALDTYEWMAEDGSGWALSSTLKGFANGGDPFALVDKAADFTFLRENPEYIRDVWQQHIADTPYKAAAVISQDETPPAPSARPLTDAKLDALRAREEAFDAWVDAPEPEGALDALPRLRISDFAEDARADTALRGSRDGIRWWLEPDAETSILQINFAVPFGRDQWPEMAMLTRLLANQPGGGEAYLTAYADPDTPGNVLPQLLLTGGEGEAPADAVQRLAGLLRSPDWLTGAYLAACLESEAAAVRTYYENPYLVAVEAMQSDGSPVARFRAETLGSVGQGSQAYLDALEVAKAMDADKLAATLREMARTLASRRDLLLYMRGTQADVTDALDALVQALPADGEGQASDRPQAGTHDLLVVTPQAESIVHYMQTGVFPPEAYSGTLDVMAHVLQTGYLLPELRDKRGAYGAAAVAYAEGYITFGASGASSLDETYAVLMGAGEYLRSLTMTPETLESMIVSVVHTFDAQNPTTQYHAMDGDLAGPDTDALRQHRSEILSTTVEELRALADFVEALIGQQRVFSYTNQTGAQTKLLTLQTVEMAQ